MSLCTVFPRCFVSWRACLLQIALLMAAAMPARAADDPSARVLTRALFETPATRAQGVAA